MFCIVTYIHSWQPSLNYFSILNFTNGIYFPLSLFLVGTKLEHGEYMYVCMYVNDDNERRQRKSSQRAVGREVAEKRERERRKNESKVKEKVKENQIV